jgi:hypothetical protein
LQHRVLLRWTLLWLGVTNFERLLPQPPPSTSSFEITRLQLLFATFRPLMELLCSTLGVLQRLLASTIEASLYSLRLPPSTLEVLPALELSAAALSVLQQLSRLSCIFRT